MVAWGRAAARQAVGQGLVEWRGRQGGHWRLLGARRGEWRRCGVRVALLAPARKAWARTALPLGRPLTKSDPAQHRHSR